MKSLLTSLLLFNLSCVSATAVEKVDLFEAGKNGYALFRIPGIVVTKRGTVLAYCEARKSDRGDWGPIDVLMRRSTDGGKTWESPQKIVHVEGDLPINPLAAAQNLDRPGDNTVNNPVAIVDHETGAVHFLYCLEYMRCFYMRSDDDGVTWSEPVEITKTFEDFRSDYDWKVLATGPSHAIQLTHGPKRGRLVVPVWLSLGTGGHAHRPSVTATIFSDDHGKTWQRGDIAVPDTPEFVFPNETVVVQLADGSVMLNSRSESKHHRRLVTISPDGATGWSQPRFDEQLLEPICMAGMVRVREGVIAFSNPHNLHRTDGKETPGKGRDRKNLTIKLSDDEAQTWSASRTLEPGFSGYSDLAALPDGTILCFYERGSTDGKNHYRTGRLTVAHLTEDWVRDGIETDVCVYGGTSGGVVAAVQAARMGKRVVLLEPGRHLGGMTSGGLSAVDIGEPRSVGGIAREYFSRLVARYGKTLKWDQPFKGKGGPATGGAYSIEPHVAENVFDEMAREAGVTVLREARLASVKKHDARIAELTTEDGRTIRAKMFLDTTYEGDLLAAAGVSYTLMREGNAKYGETYNGIHYAEKYKPRIHHLKPGANGRVPGGQGVWDRDFPLDPYVVKGDPASGLLPLVNEGEPGTPGEPAPGVMAYCFRLCLSTADDRLPIEPPPDYDPQDYELVARFIEACQEIGDDMDLRWFSKHDPLPNQKWDFNTATFGGNLPGASWEWPEANYDRREEIAKEIENYHRGLLHFLATDPRVPERVRTGMARFGLPRDEFTDNGGWPHQIYVREGRRMISDLVMTEHHTFGRTIAPDSIGLGSYGTDIHEIRRIAKDGVVIREGKVAGGRGGFGPYNIGYGAIVPKQTECENLFATYALSASHSAFASLRMEPVFMVTSQSAATAACLAIDEDVAVQQVDYEKLKTHLLADGQILSWPPPAAAAPGAKPRNIFAQSGEPVSCDVAIYGATPAGIAAALAAAEGECSVLLIEPTSRIGGMTTHGLSHSDFHSFEALHGPFLQFSQRVLAHYESTYGKDSEQVRDCWRGTHGEPSVNLLVFQEMLAEKPSILVLSEHRLAKVTKECETITGLTFSRPNADPVTITPKIAIDASYEGDLFAAAGVPYRVGREARSEYGESLAPEESDDQVQGYNYRLCMTRDPNNRVPVPVPANYDREDYAALVPLVKADKFRAAFGYPGSPFVLKAHLPSLPNGKHDINDVSKGLVRLSMPGRNRDYPEGDLATRRRIEQEHLDWQLGLIHFVQTDSALPDAFRKEASTWGLCRDEFADTNHIPPQIYVREARRMVGLRVYTEADTEYAANDARARLHPDSIAVGEYSHNCHGTGHEGAMIGGRHTGEFYKGVAPYQIPYGVIVPAKIRNLLVPTACSASHVGFCAIRLEPIWMALGGAAGHAASLAFDGDVPVQQVDVETLQQRIWSHDGATIHVSDVPPSHPDFIAVQWWGGLGGLHGLEPAPDRPGARGKHIVSQYFEAFPGHAAKLDLVLDDDLKNRWTELVKAHGLPVPDAATRGDWIRKAFAAFQRVGSKLNAQKVNKPSTESNSAEVIVYGSTPGGFCAAIAAAREGASVILLEPTNHVGGMSTGGLSHCDSNQMVRSTLMGLFDEWHRRVVKDYTDRGLDAPYDPMKKDQSKWCFEPHVAMRVTLQMLDEAGVTVLTKRYLQSVTKEGPRITSLTTTNGTFTARVFVDGSYEGDLMAAAGVDWTIGREGRDEYGESLAGKQYPKAKMNINGFDGHGELLPLVTTDDGGAAEAGDENIMTYSFRLCLTTEPDNRVPMPIPTNYDPGRFEVVRRALKAGEKRIGFDLYPLPGNKLDGNNSIGGQFSIGLIGGGNRWHSADEGGRKKIWEAHKQYTLEFIHFLITDPSVPKAIRDKYAALGLCKDEFVDNEHFPPALYVRESRRMKGLYVISQKDILEQPVKDDPIAISSFPIDSHDVQRIALKDGGVINEGTIFPVRNQKLRQGYAYHVPYRSILPRPEQCDNLLVPVALSCTHVGISSLRIEGAWMVIGQGAGVAAALAADQGVPVQELDYQKLRERLLAQKQVLELPERSEPPSTGDSIATKTLPGIVLDDSQAMLRGQWTRSTNFKPYIENGYIFSGEKDSKLKGNGKTTATFRVKVPQSDRYHLLMAYSAHETRAKNVGVTITSGTHSKTIVVDQTMPLPDGKHFRPIGTVDLDANADTIVQISNGGTVGFVILDAIQLLPARPASVP